MTRREVILVIALGCLMSFVIGRATTGVASVLRGGIPDKKGLIHVCYRTSDGSLRVIDPSLSKCKAGEGHVTWNIKGAAGPKGEIGPQGPPGPQGPAGSAGYTVVTKTYTFGAAYHCWDTISGPSPAGWHTADLDPNGDGRFNECTVDSIPIPSLPVAITLLRRTSAKAVWEPWSPGLEYGCQLVCVAWRDGKLDLALSESTSPEARVPVGWSFQYGAVYKTAP